jgi:hypothetical protein
LLFAAFLVLWHVSLVAQPYFAATWEGKRYQSCRL